MWRHLLRSPAMVTTLSQAECSFALWSPPMPACWHSLLRQPSTRLESAVALAVGPGAARSNHYRIGPLASAQRLCPQGRINQKLLTRKPEIKDATGQKRGDAAGCHSKAVSQAASRLRSGWVHNSRPVSGQGVSSAAVIGPPPSSWGSAYVCMR